MIRTSNDDLMSRGLRDGCTRWLPEDIAILTQIDAAHRIPRATLFSRDRHVLIVVARHHLWSMLRERGNSLPDIAGLCGVDHTTVLSGVRSWRRQFAPPPPVMPVDAVLVSCEPLANLAEALPGEVA